MTSHRHRCGVILTPYSHCPAGTSRQNDVVLTYIWRHHISTTSVRRQYDVISTLRVCWVGPAGTWRKHDVVLTSMRCDDVVSTSIRCHFGTICPLGFLSHLHFFKSSVPCEEEDKHYLIRLISLWVYLFTLGHKNAYVRENKIIEDCTKYAKYVPVISNWNQEKQTFPYQSMLTAQNRPRLMNSLCFVWPNLHIGSFLCHV